MSPDPWTGTPRGAPGAWSASRELRWRALDAIARRAPRTGLRLAGAVASAAHRAGWLGPGPELLAPLLPGRSAAALRRIARAVAARAAMTRCLARLAEAGCGHALDAVVDRAARARVAATSALGPSVLVSFHAGVWPALGYLMDAAERPVLILEMESAPRMGDRASTERYRIRDDAQSRARALKRAVERLREGAAVLLLADEAGGSDRSPGRVLGRPLAISRGPAWLAARTGAGIVPLVARWVGRRPEVALRADAPFAPAGADAQGAVAARLAGWLDAHLREHPEDLLVELVERLVAPGGG